MPCPHTRGTESPQHAPLPSTRGLVWIRSTIDLLKEVRHATVSVGWNVLVYGDGGNLIGAETCLIQTAFQGPDRIHSEGVLHADKPFFLSIRYDLAVANNRHGGIAVPLTDSALLSLRGGGTGTLYFAQNGSCDASNIVLSGTTDKSILTITTAGIGNGTFVGGIDTQGLTIGAIVAATTDLSGNVTIGASPNPNASVALTFDQIENASITTGIPVKSLTASEWLDDDGTPDVLTAPTAGTISIKGKSANWGAGIAAIPGNFQADLDLGGSGGSVLALNSLTVAGDIDNSSTITAII